MRKTDRVLNNSKTVTIAKRGESGSIIYIPLENLAKYNPEYLNLHLRFINGTSVIRTIPCAGNFAAWKLLPNDTSLAAAGNLFLVYSRRNGRKDKSNVFRFAIEW